VHVRAKRRSAERGHDFGPLADELDLIVDRERGVLLRVAVVVVDDEELSAIEITEVTFDEAVPGEIFRPLR
jgi:outer membrane lipoprotein-sorting protein